MTTKRSSKSRKVAIGGVFSALCVISLCSSLLIPFFQYAAPLLASAMMIPVLEENGPKVSILVYVSASVLALFIVPDREPVLLFVAFFGYYPTLSQILKQKIRSRPVVWIIQLAVFNAALLAIYWVGSYLFGLQEVMEEMQKASFVVIVGWMGMANVLFVIYDFTLQRYVLFYRQRFRKWLSQ